MMRPIQGFIAIAMLTALPLLSPPLAHAAMPSPSQKQVIDRFIDCSSYEPQFQQLPQLVREALAGDIPNELSTARRQELTTLLLDSFEAGRARNAMAQQLSLGYENRRYLTIIQKLERQPLSKLRDMERSSLTDPVARNELQQFIARLQEKPVPPGREALVKELLAASGALENTLQTRAALHEVMLTLMAKKGSEQNRTNQNGALEQGHTPAETKQAAVAGEPLSQALFIYRDASDEELKQYLEFYNSAAGQWFKRTQQNGWIGALRNIGRDVAWKLQQPGAADVQTASDDDLGAMAGH